jgi:hypothetical protein
MSGKGIRQRGLDASFEVRKLSVGGWCRNIEMRGECRADVDGIFYLTAYVRDLRRNEVLEPVNFLFEGYAKQ